MRLRRATATLPAPVTWAITTLALVMAFLATPEAAQAQESYTIEALKEAPPAALAAPVRETLQAQGYRVVDGKGKPYADLWLRKTVPASAAPGGPKGAVLFPFLADGELIGALRYAAEGYDNRDQAIPKGTYTLRYGLQPVNGDHLGVSPHRDYTLLLPAADDADPAVLARKNLEEKSSDTAGTSHPAILLLEAPNGDGPAPPAIARDDEKNTWSAVLPMVPSVGGAAAKPVPIQVVIVGVVGG